jgi:hypothetical protein
MGKGNPRSKEGRDLYYAVDWVNRIENSILITEKGNEVLNRTPYCQKMLGRGSCDGPCCMR